MSTPRRVYDIDVLCTFQTTSDTCQPVYVASIRHTPSGVPVPWCRHRARATGNARAQAKAIAEHRAHVM